MKVDFPDGYCPCCMECGKIETIHEKEKTVFKGVEVEYDAVYRHCPSCDGYFETEMLMSANSLNLKDAYRMKTGLLTSREIVSLRETLGMTQADLSRLLGWGGKTITRYEGHQVQDKAHDTILRKLIADPEWYLALLSDAEESFPPETYGKYVSRGIRLYEEKQDRYLVSSINATYAQYRSRTDLNGGTELDLDKIAAVIDWFASRESMKNLYSVKLCNLLWYSDTLSYEKLGRSITGLVYRALPMGAVPVAYDRIFSLGKIRSEKVCVTDNIALRFIPSGREEYPELSSDERMILMEVAERFKDDTASSISEKMHGERAWRDVDDGGYVYFMKQQ